MQKTLCTAALLAAAAMPVNSYAFDFGGMIVGAVKDAVTDVVKDTAKDATKSTVKAAASSAGVSGADKYIDMAVDNSDGIQNAAGNVQATSAMLNAGGATGMVAKANAAAVAVREARAMGTSLDATPGDDFRAEYHSISAKMSACGSDSKCLFKYQQQLLALQQRSDDYVASTGDANYNGKNDSIDAQIMNPNTIEPAAGVAENMKQQMASAIDTEAENAAPKSNKAFSLIKGFGSKLLGN